MRVHLQTLGCRLNEAELESWARDFRASGYELSNDPVDADLVVINTCAVTREAVKKSRKLMRRTHRENPAAKLVMSGCYASLDPQQAAGELGVDLLVPNTQKEDLVEIATRELELPTMPAMAMEPAEQSLLSRNRQRAFIKVQDGCRYRCTYCIVTLARGEEKSRDADSIVQEIDQLHHGGIQEVVLAGVHLGGYGSDLGSNLYELVTTVLERTEIPRIRLGSLEPWDLPGNFWGLFENERLMPHLHLPLQSGADSVLRRMSRRCSAQEYNRILEAARKAHPSFNITTDIIVGFPGETAEEWQQTKDFVEQADFAHIHIFAFSPRQGTKAARLPDPIPREVKRQRSEELHQLAANSRRKVLADFVGNYCDVLVEGVPEKRGRRYLCSGYTPNYIKVKFYAAQNPGNRIVRVMIKNIFDNNGELVGEAVG